MKYIAMKNYKNSFCKVNITCMLMWQAKLHLKQLDCILVIIISLLLLLLCIFLIIGADFMISYLRNYMEYI